MLRLTALACGLLLAAAQDPAEKLGALVEKLGSDEIADREKASADLVKLGPSALPAIRDHLAKSQGERKARLQAIVTLLDREERLYKLLDSPPVVSIKVRDQAVEAVLADISRQTGFQVEGFFLDNSFRTTVTLDRVPLWKALDEIGRLHGGLVAHYFRNHVLLEPGERAGSPLILHRGFGFHIRPLVRAGGAPFVVQGVINYAPGLPVWSTRIEYKELTDDQGTSLLAPAGESDLSLGSRFAGPSHKSFAAILNHLARNEPAKKATRLARARGSAIVGLALDLKPLVVIPDPLKEAKRSGSGNGFQLTIKAVKREGAIHVKVTSLSLPDEEEFSGLDVSSVPRWAFAIRDRQGALHVGHSRAWGLDDAEMQVEVALPAGKEAATFELLEPEKLSEVEIPFDFKDLPIKTR